MALDRRSLRPFRQANRSTATATLTPALVVGARRLEVRELRGTSILDLLGLEALEVGREFQAMTQIVEEDLPRLKGPFWYLSPEREFVRALNPRRVATFLLDHLGEIRAAIYRLDAHPAEQQAHIKRVQPAGALIDMEATRALIRARPHVLEEHEYGPINAAGKRWMPALVSVRRRSRDLSTPENRRLLAFFERLWRDARTTQESIDDTHVRSEVEQAQAMIAGLIHDTFLRQVQGREDDRPILDPIGLEAVEPDYARLHALRVRYLTEASPGADVPELERQHTARADEIFQAFACYVIAEAMGLEPVGRGLRDRDASKVSFRGTGWELLYDVGGEIPSWRAQTVQPDDYRPDIVLRRIDNHWRVVVLDAKYSIDSATGWPPNERLKEVQAYMHSFRVPKIGVLYPGRTADAIRAFPHDVAAEGLLIRGLPIRGLDG
jgi:hypothetical protein